MLMLFNDVVLLKNKDSYGFISGREEKKGERHLRHHFYCLF